MTLFDYTPTEFVERVVEKPDLEDCRSLVDSDSVTWIDVDGVHDLEILQTLGDQFGLHALTIEDLANTTQRPKLEIHDGHISLALKMCALDEGAMRLEHVTLILGPCWVLSFQEERGDVFEAVRRRVREGRGRLRTLGPDYLANCLVDAVVDGYFAVTEHTGEELLRMEDLAADGDPGALKGRLHAIRRELILVRKSAWPLREAIGALRRDGADYVKPETLPFIADVHDHAMQVVETVDALRELAASVRELYLSMLNVRMNDTMRVLTVIATIFIPLTFVAGIYGMNFKSMPELELSWGYPAALGFMALIGGVMLIFFRRRNWI